MTEFSHYVNGALIIEHMGAECIQLLDVLILGFHVVYCYSTCLKRIHVSQVECMLKLIEYII